MASVTIPRVVRDHVERRPEREVVTFRDLGKAADRDEALRYGDLWMQASAFAEALSSIAPQGRVLIVLPLGSRLIAAHLGTLLAGGIPIIHSHPSEKVSSEAYNHNLQHVIELLQPEAVITNSQFMALVSQVHTEHSTVCVQTEDIPLATGFSPSAWQHTDPEQIAIIQHSSGSTGLQKGGALTHAMVISQCDAYARAIALDANTDRVCSWIPLYHDMGLFTTWLLPLLRAVRVAAIDPFQWVQAPASFLRLITDFRGTLCWQPNFAYNLLATRVRDEDLEGIDLVSMRGFTNCSEPVRASSHRMFLDRFREHGVKEESLWVCYAMAENSFAVTAAGSTFHPVNVRTCDPVHLSYGSVLSANNGRGTEVVSVGHPIDGCEIRIVDEHRRDLPEARIGEVAIRAPYTFREYYRNPEATARAIDGAGWYYSGDLGFILDGQLFITGRKKDLLIVGGRNFYPQDIEAICDTCPHAVPGRSVAIGVEDEKTGTERIVVLIESHATESAEQDELVRTARKRIFEELDCPISEVHVVPHMWLLKTTSGKIARQPNLDRFREQFGTRNQEEATRECERMPYGAVAVSPLGLMATLGWSLAVAVTIYLLTMSQTNVSWGIYAGF